MDWLSNLENPDSIVLGDTTICYEFGDFLLSHKDIPFPCIVAVEKFNKEYRVTINFNALDVSDEAIWSVIEEYRNIAIKILEWAKENWNDSNVQ